MASKDVVTDEQLQYDSNRKTRIPVADIKKLIKLQSDLNALIQQLIEKHNLPMGYIRGVLKEPTSAVEKRKSKSPTKRTSSVKTSTVTKKAPSKKVAPAKKTTARKTTKKTKKPKKSLDDLLGF